MSELKYNQIVDKLNTEFASEGRRLVFWYDDNGYFADDVDAMPLQNAKIWHLTPTNQFRTKILLEREDSQSNYLIYAPFPKPPVEQNHLEDTILYSKQFHADPISLLCSDLGIGAEGKAVLQKYAKVVGEQTRKQRFCDYKLAAYTADAVETALFCTVLKLRGAALADGAEQRSLRTHCGKFCWPTPRAATPSWTSWQSTSWMRCSGSTARQSWALPCPRRMWTS